MGGLWLVLLACRSDTPPPQVAPTESTSASATASTGATADTATPSSDTSTDTGTVPAPTDHEILVFGAASDTDPSCLVAVGVTAGTVRTLYCAPPNSDGTPATVIPGTAEAALGQVPLVVTRTLDEAGGPDARHEVVVVDIETGAASLVWRSDDVTMRVFDAGLVADGLVGLLYTDDLAHYKVAITSTASSTEVWSSYGIRPDVAFALGELALLAGEETLRIDLDGTHAPIDLPNPAVAVVRLQERWAVTQWVETGAHESILLSLLDDDGTAAATTEEDFGSYAAEVPQVVQRADGLLFMILTSRLHTWSGIEGEDTVYTPGTRNGRLVVLGNETLLVESDGAYTLDETATATLRCEGPAGAPLIDGTWSLTGGHAVVTFDRQGARTSLLRCDADGGLADLSALSGVTGSLVPWR